MGWKAIKEHYGIEYIVATYKDKGICIGSNLCHDLITIDPVKRTIESRAGIGSQNRDLREHWAAFHSNTDQLWSLAAATDTFEKSLPVFTYKDGNILDLYCEEYGWPNITHDGRIMLENAFFPERQEAIDYGIKCEKFFIDRLSERTDDLWKELIEAKLFKTDKEANLATLIAMSS